MNYRSRKILDSARYVPHCMSCMAHNGGSVVMAHANWSEYGKGTGIKAHDWAVAAICHDCHMEIDSGSLTRQEKKEKWLSAHIKTIEWLFENGIVK